MKSLQPARQLIRVVRPAEAKLVGRLRRILMVALPAAVIEEQLLFEPENETRNRKPLQQPAPFEATWELRFGPDNRFRVLYGVDHERRGVQVQAIGVQKGNRLFVGGEEVE